MRKSDVIGFATSGQKADLLRNVKENPNGVADWILEGLQDLGLIDHKNNLTADGENLLQRSRS